MMSGLMLIFLYIAIIMISQIEKDSSISEAIEKFNNIDNKLFLCFASPQDRENIKNKFTTLFSKINYKFIKNKEDYEEMLIMSNCAHNIIANSSFSWWGAWMNDNPNKIVIYPSVWFGPKLSKHNLKDLCPSTWIKLV